ncbi:SDR family NAD(P)-dependent oxidoreductase [Modestobacter sp. I12A-02662]|uniref:SDR family NAD(P)-dependent oxidoreductase n=1 Tax=Modestobacter sp. I12A-02662 TaxID=1730496 RepID=UPI0034DF5F37
MTETNRPLTGKVALVTGASSGIGEATAIALAEAGAAVAIGARRRDRLDALAGELREGGASVLQLDLDVTDEEQCRTAVARTRAVLYVVGQPPHVAINELLVRPTDQER